MTVFTCAVLIQIKGYKNRILTNVSNIINIYIYTYIVTNMLNCDHK